MQPSRFYVTTPIYYATDEPHVGHAYTTIAADAAARFHRLLGEEVFFLTGTDEHGQKMERQAQKLGLAPRELADRTVPRYQDLWRELLISNDRFVRTTEPAHREAVLEMWRRMTGRGDIYRGEYEGRYCVGCETFYPDKELVEGRCPVHGSVAEPVKEQGWFFRLSGFAERLLSHYEAYPEFITPESRRNEVLSFVRGGLRDLSISRGTTRWGIPVPGDPEQVIYVWVDALTNYLTGAGFPRDEGAPWWPADLQLLGKDILRFHAVYWPAFLLSAGLPLPRRLLVHGWWLRDEKKISKSGEAVGLRPLLDTFGPDAVRYFLLREIPFGLDGSYSDEAFVGRYNSDLANDFGNLVSRALQMIGRYRDGVIPPGPAALPPALREQAVRAVEGLKTHFAACAFSRGIESMWELVRAGNRFVDEKAPWVLARDPARKEELDGVLYTSAELVRLVAAGLSPVLPGKSAQVRAFLGLEGEGFALADLAPGGLLPGGRLGAIAPLFPRVDEKQWLYLPERKGNLLSETNDAVPPAAAHQATSVPRPALEETKSAPAELISIDEFFRADLKTGRVKSAERVEKSKKLLKLIVDLGGGDERQIVAGIAEKYAPEQVVGRSVVVVANLKPARLMGVESQGMLLAASLNGLPILAGFEEEVPPGTRVK